ncbi:MAG: chromosome segregation protein SMC [Lachnospiraceae bacterium]|nr:chromosome segregation protein SMC [Lachnospiraceae bacterium]
MYLKSIEVHGFKAFANKIRFEFDGGITGIVGPNGSGKSNVADAVRWVLGEQSAKQLRGSSMQDVIFAGTETRKPMSFAYVSLTLDNSDHKLPISYEEVTVARRVYRSGESEYLINGSECRLRDVQDLFFDTGIGKEGYSIIGQGQIDKVLSGKPEERREIFDEAAGITRVKKRKLQTEKNLAEERQNLARVNDIIAEIEGRLEPLAKQDEKAREYLKLREELRDREVNQFLMEYEKNIVLKKENDDHLATVNADLAQATADYEKAKDEYDRLLNELEQHREALSQAKERNSQYRIEAEKGSGERNVLTEQVATFSRQVEQNEEHIASLRGLIAEREEELARYSKKQEEYAKQLSELAGAKEAAETKLGEMKSEIDARITREQELRASQIAILEKNTELKTELERNNTLLEQYNISKAETNAKLLQFKTEADEANRKIEEATKLLADVAAEVAKMRDESDHRDERIRSLTESISDANARLETVRKKATLAETKFETLRNLAERYEGYAATVRKVMEEKKTRKGIRGVVADIIQTEERYETAIETALGGNIQNIVVDNTDTAKSLIEYLKKDRLGRATFLPLKEIRAKKDEFEKDVFSEPGVLGIASELVSTEEEYREAAAYLLGRFLVVDTIDHAIALEKKYRQKLRVVTLEGELFAPGGAVSGGAFKNAGNLLGRRREAEEAEKEFSERKKESEACERTVAKYRKEREALRNEQEIARGAIQERMIAKNTAEMDLQHVKEQNGGLLETRDALKKEVSEAEAEIEKIRGINRDLTEQIGLNEQQSEKDRDTADRLHAEMEEIRSRQDEASAEAVRTLTEYNGLLQSVEYQRDTGERIERERAQYEKDLAQAEKSNREAKESIAEREKSIREIEERQCELQRDIQNTDEQIGELTKLAEDITKQNRDFFERRENLSRTMSSLDREQYRLQSQKEKMEDQLEANTRYMWEEYGMTYTEACEHRSPEYDNATLNRKAVYELKNKIRGLGNVNVDAIEEYRDAKERYEFLTGQRKDIMDAETTLSGIIAALDEEMRKQFTETFEQLKTRFDRVFRELFGGGKTTLSLSEGEDVLEAGILINVQPPGKKLQNMMQLSGGEKALTAIALLFAILDLKPSPFCLLDEIEAALDDSNVGRFAQYLRKLSDETQFIVITHRRGTMAAAEALYGITMQEKGVSTLVSVNLIESELDQ